MTAAACRCTPFWTCGTCYAAESAIDNEQDRRNDPDDPFDGDFDVDFHFPRNYGGF